MSERALIFDQASDLNPKPPKPGLLGLLDDLKKRIRGFLNNKPWIHEDVEIFLNSTKQRRAKNSHRARLEELVELAELA